MQEKSETENQMTALPSEGLDADTIQKLRNLMNKHNASMFAELINIYVRDSSIRLEAMQTSLEQKDFKTLQRDVHTLCGSSGNMGAKRLSALCRELELKIRNGNVEELEGLEPMLTHVAVEFCRVKNALLQELQMEESQ